MSSVVCRYGLIQDDSRHLKEVACGFFSFSRLSHCTFSDETTAVECTSWCKLTTMIILWSVTPFTFSSHQYSVIKLLAFYFLHNDAICLKWSQRQDLHAAARDPELCIALEEDHFRDFIQLALSSAGFTGQLLDKPSSPCLESKPKNGPDGCALFYRFFVFKLLNKTELRLVKQESPGDRQQIFVESSHH